MPTATKRTSPAKSPATPALSKELPEIAATPERRGPAPFYDPADLTRTHELIIDAVTTLLTTGGHTEDVDSLLYSAMSHTRRRTFSGFTEDQDEIARVIREFIKADFDNWKHDLVTAWRKNRRPDMPHVEPHSITERIRANTREDLASSFEDFMQQASPEEMRLMHAVMMDWESRHHVAEAGKNEMYLGMAFEYQLGHPRCYVRIPDHMVDRVEKYVEALRAIEDKAVA
jgi:hypothetical protein